MVAHELILDPERVGLVHTTIACSALIGLANLAAADRRGLVIPTWAAHGLKPCPCCTLVAEPVWAIAA